MFSNEIELIVGGGGGGINLSVGICDVAPLDFAF